MSNRDPLEDCFDAGNGFCSRSRGPLQPSKGDHIDAGNGFCSRSRGPLQPSKGDHIERRPGVRPIKPPQTFNSAVWFCCACSVLGQGFSFRQRACSSCRHAKCRACPTEVTGGGGPGGQGPTATANVHSGSLLADGYSSSVSLEDTTIHTVKSDELIGIGSAFQTDIAALDTFSLSSDNAAGARTLYGQNWTASQRVVASDSGEWSLMMMDAAVDVNTFEEDEEEEEEQDPILSDRRLDAESTRANCGHE
ncbi:hypothetical protein CLCR_10736 [Cladophialophora carrionii]|uniref:Uncharacterized protein n=1 Tax=Cladophialophora carrionii TaxID=86049 RepID=A0A1C1CWZ7_9EURO|nr:hypothetical protein CLCR_10736 [Cladophialophora carrionii]